MVIMDRLVIDRRFWLLPLLFWTIVVMASYSINIRSLDQHIFELTANQGRFIFKMVEAMRIWNARHGGVYVYADDDTPPNPYLDVPDRDIVTSQGKHLTLVNPAYMTRQLSRTVLAEAQVGLRLTSLKPLNPHNKPDAWEESALREFESGSYEKVAVLENEGNRTARYIGALTTRRDCLRCHQKQGYRLGDVRGGISVSFSAEPYFKASMPQRINIKVIHLVAWFMLISMTLYALRQIRTRVLLLKRAEEEQHLLVVERTRQLQHEVWERNQAELRLRRLVDASGEGIYGIAVDGSCTFCNPTACRLLGLTNVTSILGHDIHQFVSGNNSELRARLDSYRAGGTVHAETDSFRRADGSSFPVEYRIVPILVEGKVMGAVATFQDITERKRTQAQVWMKANYDHLTGLPNRSLFHDRLERAVLHEARSHGQIAVLFIDLDGFKEVNDQLGHEAGDALLKEAAQRISSCIRESDTAARLGGDEFTVVLTEISGRSGVREVADKILAAIATPYRLPGAEARVSCSIGIALYPHDAETVTALLHKADKAMYKAKRIGKNAIVFHGDDTDRRGQHLDEAG